MIKYEEIILNRTHKLTLVCFKHTAAEHRHTRAQIKLDLFFFCFNKFDLISFRSNWFWQISSKLELLEFAGLWTANAKPTE